MTLTDDQLAGLEGHTDGPWMRNGDVIDGGNRVLACRGAFAPETRDIDCCDVWELNAALIAAAPDLLHEVKRLRLDADVLLHQTTGQMLNAARAKADELRVARDAAIEVAEKTTDLVDRAIAQRDKLALTLRDIMPAAQIAVNVTPTGSLRERMTEKVIIAFATLSTLESVEAAQPKPMHWQCSLCGNTLPDDELTGSTLCYLQDCGGFYESRQGVMEVNNNG